MLVFAYNLEKNHGKNILCRDMIYLQCCTMYCYEVPAYNYSKNLF